ncbi:MAG: TIGR04283 family arsenosugar biosynthesis glycosyltransferase [Pseudomonadota bacterium]
MISVIIPTLNAQSELPATLSALVPGVVSGVIRDVIIVDGGSTDKTLAVADAAGATLLMSEPGRGRQLSEGAEVARGSWLLFLHADTVLETGWDQEVGAFMDRIDCGVRPEAAAAFRFALDDLGFLPRVIEAGVSMRCTLFRMPYGDQGLLIPRRLYGSVGGYKPLDLMEDVDLMRRLGRARTIILRSRAITSAIRYRRDGYMKRVARNWICLLMYYFRLPNSYIARFYGLR